ncbi:DUF2861 family protein [Thaumasiovibrio subtropicus]|uniref:DUF2861 family protein n=1 Tax=Thaumasiovibrio subtropicus TaxID=1891207 RepID=UPI000B34B53D|nr:DUF2861 family protein [Thaumasiovibrio subtropicus]
MKGYLLAAAVVAIPVHAEWFAGKDPLTRAHQLLLQGEVSTSFEQMVQIWQQQPETLVADNLTELLSASIGLDCGRVLTAHTLPEWLSELAVQREAVQHVNQLNYSVTVQGAASVNSLAIELQRWPDEVIVSGRTAVSRSGKFKISFHHLSETLPRGLYRLAVNSANKGEWSQWLILGEAPKVQRISWVDTYQWRIENNKLPLKACPAPMLEQAVFPIDRLYQQVVWEQKDQGKLPRIFDPDDTKLKPGQYWLSVGLVDSRWQGDVKVQEVQRLIKPTEVHPPATIIEVTNLAF